MIRVRFRAFKPPILVISLLGGLVVVLSACGPSEPVAPAKGDRADSAEAGYVAPPIVDTARRAANGVSLAGKGAPDSDLRMGSPTGEVVMGRVDGVGQWTITVPNAPGVRLFGLSTTHDGRTVQAEGYVMVAESGEVALLRAGAGAVRLAEASSSPRILTVDVDRGGGAVVSGVAAPGAGLNVRVDRITQGGARTDENGRFFISLRGLLTPGVHDIQVAGEGGENAVSIATSSASPLTYGPVRAEKAANGWRVDWMTPGGGVQSTYLIGDAR